MLNLQRTCKKTLVLCGLLACAGSNAISQTAGVGDVAVLQAIRRCTIGSTSDEDIALIAARINAPIGRFFFDAKSMHPACLARIIDRYVDSGSHDFYPLILQILGSPPALKSLLESKLSEPDVEMLIGEAFSNRPLIIDASEETFQILIQHKSRLSKRLLVYVFGSIIASESSDISTANSMFATVNQLEPSILQGVLAQVVALAPIHGRLLSELIKDNTACILNVCLSIHHAGCSAAALDDPRNWAELKINKINGDTKAVVECIGKMIQDRVAGKEITSSTMILVHRFGLISTKCPGRTLLARTAGEKDSESISQTIDSLSDCSCDDVKGAFDAETALFAVKNRCVGRDFRSVLFTRFSVDFYQMGCAQGVFHDGCGDSRSEQYLSLLMRLYRY